MFQVYSIKSPKFLFLALIMLIAVLAVTTSSVLVAALFIVIVCSFAFYMLLACCAFLSSPSGLHSSLELPDCDGAICSDVAVNLDADREVQDPRRPLRRPRLRLPLLPAPLTPSPRLTVF